MAEIKHKKLSKEMLLNYLVDVLGYDEQEAKHEISVYRLPELLSVEQVDECIAYNS